MNKLEYTVIDSINRKVNWDIGGWENGILDNNIEDGDIPTREQYEDWVYNRVVSKHQTEVRFIGTNRIKELIKLRLDKEDFKFTGKEGV